MTRIPIPYGTGIQVLEVAEERLKAVLHPQPPRQQADQQTLVQAALEHPIASPRLCKLAKEKKSVLLITSDHTRPVPSRVTMPLYIQEIRKENPDIQITILIATGMHRPTTKAELRAKLCDDIVDRETIVVHEAEKS